MSTISLKDLNTRFKSQFCRINGQMFSGLLSSDARGGGGAQGRVTPIGETINAEAAPTP